MAEDEMRREHHGFSGSEFGQTPGVSVVWRAMQLQRVAHDLATEQQQEIETERDQWLPGDGGGVELWSDC